MVKLEDVLQQLDETRYLNIKRAVELGKWADGRVLPPEERELCLQIVIAWDARHKPETERVGYIHREAHEHCEELPEPDDSIIHKAR